MALTSPGGPRPGKVSREGTTGPSSGATSVQSCSAETAGGEGGRACVSTAGREIPSALCWQWMFFSNETFSFQAAGSDSEITSAQCHSTHKDATNVPCQQGSPPSGTGALPSLPERHQVASYRPRLQEKAPILRCGGRRPLQTPTHVASPEVTQAR